MDETTKNRLSAPGPGQSISVAAEHRACRVRAAVRTIRDSLKSRSFEKAFDLRFAPRLPSLSRASLEPKPVRAAWAMVNTWLLGMKSANGRNFGLLEAEDWFVGERNQDLPSLARSVPKAAREEAIAALRDLRDDPDLLDLLPYVLEPHGPGSRLSVMRDPSTRIAEGKETGRRFLTPADVAEYMVASCSISTKARPVHSYTLILPAAQASSS